MRELVYMFPTAIHGLYNIVGWQISNSLEKENQTTLQQTIATYGKPEIINSDQRSQYTCATWVKTLQELDIRISMDGKGRATDHAIIERWFRTLKQKYIYLNPPETSLSLFYA